LACGPPVCYREGLDSSEDMFAVVEIPGGGTAVCMESGDSAFPKAALFGTSRDPNEPPKEFDLCGAHGVL